MSRSITMPASSGTDTTVLKVEGNFNGRRAA